MVVLHVLLFFRGIFPWFGFWLANPQGFVLMALSVLCLVLLTWGVLRLGNWAWWGALIYLGRLSLLSWQWPSQPFHERAIEVGPILEAHETTGMGRGLDRHPITVLQFVLELAVDREDGLVVRVDQDLDLCALG